MAISAVFIDEASSKISLPRTFQIKIAKEALIEGEKEEEGMQEEGLW